MPTKIIVTVSTMIVPQIMLHSLIIFLASACRCCFTLVTVSITSFIVQSSQAFPTKCHLNHALSLSLLR
jgi:hypothetical protein